MAYYIIPPYGEVATPAYSLTRFGKGVDIEGSTINTRFDRHAAVKAKDETTNPTVLPEEILQGFQFAFLIRHPRSSVPSFYRCTVPPLDKVTGFYNYMPSEAGYAEVRRLFDYLRVTGRIGPNIRRQGGNEDETANGKAYGSEVDICVIDADDLLDNPSGIIEAFCHAVDIKYDPAMLSWDNEEGHKYARKTFEKWNGFHDDAINSTALRPRAHVSLIPCLARHTSNCNLVHLTDARLKKIIKSSEQEDAEWEEKYGAEGAKLIRETVEANLKDYEYLKQFAIKV